MRTQNLSSPHAKVFGGLIAVVAIVALAATAAGSYVSLMGGISPGASHIALSLAGPAGASLDSFASPDRDPSLPAASAVFAESTTIAQVEIASF
jgi:hypothetical protein